MVISPLRALMLDQCEKLWEAGLYGSVGLLSGDQDEVEIADTMARVSGGEVLLLYVAPERFRSRRFRKMLEDRLSADGRAGLWVFDEAHCITQWGHDFRPDFLHVARKVAREYRFRATGVTPVVLCTATFPKQGLDELERRVFGGETPFDRGGDAAAEDQDLLRPTIRFESRQVEADRDNGSPPDGPRASDVRPWERQPPMEEPPMEDPPRERQPPEEFPDHHAKAMAERLQPGQSEKARGRFDPCQSRTLVFVTRRLRGEELAVRLENSTRLRCHHFHAGMTADEKAQTLDDFRGDGPLRVLCATKAFGLGMDLPDIHLVLHDGPASGLEDYLQEVGRAARDPERLEAAGLPAATGVLVWQAGDFRKMRDRIRRSEMRREYLREIDNYLEKLEQPLREAPGDDEAAEPAPLTVVVPLALFGHWLEAAHQGERLTGGETMVRLGLHWLEDLGRVRVGDYALLALWLELRGELTQEPAGLAGASQSALALWDYLLAQWEPGEPEEAGPVRLQVEIGPLCHALRFTHDALFEALRELVTRGVLRFDRRLSVSLTDNRRKEAEAQDRPGPLLQAGVESALELLKRVPPAAGVGRAKTRILTAAEVDALLDDRAGEIKDRAYQAWVEPQGSLSQDEAAEKVAAADRKALLRKGRCLFRLLRRLGCLRFRERWNRREVSYELSAGKSLSDWQTTLEPVIAALYRQIVAAHRGAALQDHHIELDAVELVEAVRQAVGKSYHPLLTGRALEALLLFLRDMGYLDYADRLFPTGLEVTRERLVEPLDEIMAAQPEVLVRMAEQNQLRDLRLISHLTMTLLAKLADTARLSRFVNDYFRKPATVADLRALLEEHLEAPELATTAAAEALSWLRRTAYCEEYDRLNEQQQAVVGAAPDRHLLVAAGPGAGKTHTILVRVARLIEGCTADGKAEDGQFTRVPPSQILLLAFNRAVVSEMRQRLHRLFRQMGFDRLASRLRVMTFHGFALGELRALGVAKPALGTCFRDLASRLEDDPAACQRLAARYRHVFIDEFQDVNDETWYLLQLLAGLPPERNGSISAPLTAVPDGAAHAWLTLVGDDDQSIYDFESGGADKAAAADRFQRIRDELGPEHEIVLSRNYRSAPAIVEHNERLRAQLPERFKMDPLTAERPPSASPTVRQVLPIREAELTVVEAIRKVQQNLATLGEAQALRHGSSRLVAVLGRTNAEVFAVKEALHELGEAAPEILVQGSESRFAQRRDVRDVLRQLEGESRQEPAERLRDLLPELLRQTVAGEWWPDSKERGRHDLLRLHQAWLTIRPQDATIGDYVDFIEEASSTGSTLHLIARTLLDDVDHHRVLLSTIHKVKGLEFPGVVVLPSQLSFTEESRPEELRIRYVAQTRAEDVLLTIDGDREQALRDAQEWSAKTSTVGPQMAVFTEMGDLYPSSFGKDRRVMRAVRSVKPGDPLRLVPRYETWAIETTAGDRLGQLAGPKRNNLAERLNDRFPTATELTGLEVTGVYYRDAEIDRVPTNIDDGTWYDRLDPDAQAHGYYLVEFAGLVRAVKRGEDLPDDPFL